MQIERDKLIEAAQHHQRLGIKSATAYVHDRHYERYVERYAESAAHHLTVAAALWEIVEGGENGC